jgi:MFS superfamily sulfate permease-like transporter
VSASVSAEPATRERDRWLSHLRLFTSLRGYRGEWLNSDLIAGLTVWAVLVPAFLASATIAGVSPEVGRYAAPPALILYAACCSCCTGSPGPTSPSSARCRAHRASAPTSIGTRKPERERDARMTEPTGTGRRQPPLWYDRLVVLSKPRGT